MKNFCLLVLCGFIAGTLLARIESAYAVAPFKKEFEAKYVKKDPATPEETALAVAVKQAKCNVCHVGKKKKDRNAYGKALSELLDRKKDKKDKAKIQEALDTVAELKSNPEDPTSPTFGKLISQGKLPCGKEPTTQTAAK